ncbi:MAG: hypothetical protein PHY48_01595 [Candidatus Cloacimonetes bacterium]|nr:hypothetical protein [Candidatus Cloacimonadota bacterium]
MYPYNGRPTEEFLRDYNLKLRELQELIESQGMNLQLKTGGRCVVVPDASKNADTIDKNYLISYSQQYNANVTDSEDTEATETVYETYEDYLGFERKLTLIHEARDNDVVIDFSAEFLDLAPIIEEKLLFKEEAQLYGRVCPIRYG